MILDHQYDPNEIAEEEKAHLYNDAVDYLIDDFARWVDKDKESKIAWEEYDERWCDINKTRQMEDDAYDAEVMFTGKAYLIACVFDKEHKQVIDDVENAAAKLGIKKYQS